MAEITISLQEDQARALKSLASRLGLRAEELARAGLEDLLARPPEAGQEVLELYRRVIEETGGASGVRDLSALLSSIAQPRMTFEGQDLYPDLADKAAALGFSIVMNHPFLDGNKRTAHAAMEAFLLLNGHELVAATPEQEQVLLGLADGKLTREQFASWIADHLQRR